MTADSKSGLPQMIKLEYLYLYSDLATKTLDLPEIGEYVKKTLPKVKVALRKDFFRYWLGKEEKEYESAAKKIAASRIIDLNRELPSGQPLPMEIEYERKNLLGPKKRKTGIFYDGFLFQNICQEILPKKELPLGNCQIVFTNQLLVTYDEADRRYHLRTSIYGVPNVISTSGIVEAPAKPKEYYYSKRLGELACAEWKEKNKGKFIDYHDRRLSEVLKGYLMQAIFYHLTGEPFCEDKNCRLYNAHWQEELIQAQLHRKKDFCEFHQKILSGF